MFFLVASFFLFPRRAVISPSPPFFSVAQLYFPLFILLSLSVVKTKQNTTTAPFPGWDSTARQADIKQHLFYPKKVKLIVFWGIFFFLFNVISRRRLFGDSTLCFPFKKKIFKFQIPLINKITTKKSVVVEWKSFTLFSVPLVS